MAIEDNKRLVGEFFRRLGESDPSAALGMLTDDVTWWVAGKPGSSPGAGTRDKRGVQELFVAMGAQFTSGMRITVKSAIAEGDKVAIELESYGELKNGRVYNNDYHCLVTVRDGKISAIREYLDTQHVITAFAPTHD